MCDFFGWSGVAFGLLQAMSFLETVLLAMISHR
jgi:hypothetical protein